VENAGLENAGHGTLKQNKFSNNVEHESKAMAQKQRYQKLLSWD